MKNYPSYDEEMFTDGAQNRNHGKQAVVYKTYDVTAATIL